jgi:hypothetical protein
MDYKVEVVREKNIIFSRVYRGYSHPSQVIRLSLKAIEAKIDYMMIYVINMYGEMWNYAVKKHEGKYKMIPFAHKIGGNREVLLAFSGSKSIAEMML